MTLNFARVRARLYFISAQEKENDASASGRTIFDAGGVHWIFGMGTGGLATGADVSR